MALPCNLLQYMREKCCSRNFNIALQHYNLSNMTWTVFSLTKTMYRFCFLCHGGIIFSCKSSLPGSQQPKNMALPNHAPPPPGDFLHQNGNFTSCVTSVYRIKTFSCLKIFIAFSPVVLGCINTSAKLWVLFSLPSALLYLSLFFIERPHPMFQLLDEVCLFSVLSPVSFSLCIFLHDLCLLGGVVKAHNQSHKVGVKSFSGG